MKKALSFLLAAILACTCFTVPSFADTVTFQNPAKVVYGQVGDITWPYANRYQPMCFETTVTEEGFIRFRGTKIYDKYSDETHINFKLYAADKSTVVFETTNKPSKNNVNNECMVIMPVSAGTYYFTVELPYIAIDSGTNPYMVYLFDFLNKADIGTACMETENNNTFQTADLLPLNKNLHGIAEGSDDCFAVTVTKDTPVQLQVIGFDDIYQNSGRFKFTPAGGIDTNLWESNLIRTEKYAYWNILLKKGTNYIKITELYNAYVEYDIFLSTQFKVSVPNITKVLNTGTRHEVHWTPLQDVNGYEVFSKVNNGSWKLLVTSSMSNADYFWHSGVNPNDDYQYRIRAFVKFGDVKIYGAFSTVKEVNTTPTNIKLSTTKYAYDGKSHKPKVTVKSKSGKKLTEGKDFKVDYPSGRKKIGKYTVKITFKGNYSGTGKATFEITPKKTSLSKLTAGKKSLKVKWKKQSKNTSGYQIQYSTSKKFSSPKTVTVKGGSKTSTTIKKLKAKKTYYVRVCTYKTVSGKKICSAWSTAKYKKTK